LASTLTAYVTSSRTSSARSGPAYREQQGILIGIGSVAVVVGALVAAAVPVVDGTVRYGVLAGILVIFSAFALAWAASAAVAAIGFLVFNGFIIDRSAELSWHGTADLTRLLVLAASVCVGRLLGEIYRATVSSKEKNDA
jgi:hypothetical protein